LLNQELPNIRLSRNYPKRTLVGRQRDAMGFGSMTDAVIASAKDNDLKAPIA